MFTILSIPDKNRVSKEEWEAYLNRLANYKPTKKEKINYNLMMEGLAFGEEIFHVSKEGVTRQVSIFSEEGQQVLDKFYDKE